jgi:hypothetical protein
MDQQQPILASLSAADPEVAERIVSQAVSRRTALQSGAAASAGLAGVLRAASVPVALAAFAQNAFGQARLPAVVVNVLNYALVLEELEYEFYVRAVDSGIIPAEDLPIFQTLRAHELVHRDFLRSALGASARPKPTFDFTAGNGSGTGPYAGLFSTGGYETLKAVSQAFEDTGVRAYKGQAPALQPYPDLLQAALTIHSVEARHAAQIRRLRGNFADTEPLYQGWITGSQTDVPGAQAVYAGEENTNQGGVELTTLASISMIDVTEKTESFDEPLTQAQVLAIVDPFIV